MAQILATEYPDMLLQSFQGSVMNCQRALGLKNILKEATEEWGDAIAEKASGMTPTSRQWDGIITAADMAYEKVQRAQAALDGHLAICVEYKRRSNNRPQNAA